MSDSDSTLVSRGKRRGRTTPDVVSGERALTVPVGKARRRSGTGAAAAAARDLSKPGLPLAPPPPSYFEACPDVVIRFDAQRRIVYANPALERATALPRGVFIGRRLAEIEGFAVYAPLWEAQLVTLFHSHESRWFKFSIAHPTGEKTYDVRLDIEDGVEPYATAVWRDVTVPRSALRASRAADSFVKTLIRTAPMGVAMYDAELRVREWNDFLERELNLPAHEVIGRRVDEIPMVVAHPEIMRQLEAIRDGHVRGPQLVEHELEAKPGEPPRRLRVVRTPVYDSRNQFHGMIVTCELVDRERFAETSLAALRQALDSAGEMVLEIRRNGTIVDANETALSWLGYEREQIKGIPLAAIDATLSADGFSEILEQLSGRGAWQGEARYRTRPGSEFPVDVVLQRVTPAEGDGESIFLLARDISDRKRVEAKLSDAALRFLTIFEDSPVAHLLLDAEFNIIQVNRMTSSLLDYDASELAGRNPALLLTPGDEPVFSKLRDRLARGETVAVETDQRLRRRDGRNVWVKLTARTWHDAEGKRQHLLVLEDFTERKAAEDQLQVMLRDHRTLLETMSVGVAQTLHGRIMLANREFAQLFAFGNDDLTGMSLWDLCRDHGNRLPQEVSGLPAVRERQTTSAEVVLFRKDGEPVWCLVQARPIEQSGIAEAIYTFQDISAMKRQREALSRSLLELNVVLDTTAVGVLHLSGGRVIRCNAQAYLMFGTENGDLIGRLFPDLFLPESDEAAAAARAVTEGAGSAEPLSFEAQLRGRDGKSFWALVSIRAVDPDAPGAGQIASIFDISARRAQEEQLQTLLAESRLIFDTALVGLLFVRDGRAVRANAAMEDLLACEPGGLTNQIQLFAHPTDQLLIGALAEHYAEIAAQGACQFELHMFRRKGNPIWVTVQGRAVNPERPELGHIFAFLDVDERKRSERELRATLSELQLIFDNALVAMAYVADELVVKANAAAVRMFGYAPADLRELQIDSLFADAADWHEVRAQTLSGGEVDGVIFERLMQRSDGSNFWCAGNVRPLDSTNPDRGLIIALMDVDARHRSEDELKRVRNYLDLVVEHLPVLVSVRDAQNGRFVSLNRAGELITGLSREQVVGRTWHEIYGRQFADLYAEMDRRALATGQQVERPRDVMLRADGHTLTVNQRVLPLFEPVVEGAPRARYVMSIIDDLTDEVRTEAALRETETRFRQFAENIDQLVFITTSDLSAVLYVNPRYTAVVGGPADELLDNPRAALAHVHFDDAPQMIQRLPKLVARMRRLRKTDFSVRIDHPARGVRVLSVRLNPVRMFDGTVRVFGIAEDITERTAAERERIEEAVKQRDVLVREVHHRIKNNLQGVAGLLHQQALAKPDLAATLNEAAAQIQAIAQVHGLQIRASGTLPVLGVAQGIFANLSNMFGADIRFDQPPPALWRWGLPENEAVPLALVINELGTNAIKYRASRDQSITVRLAARPEGVELRIENPGTLKPGFDLASISSSVSGLGLVKALLPRRGAKLLIEQSGTNVTTRLQLMPPAIGEEIG